MRCVQTLSGDAVDTLLGDAVETTHALSLQQTRTRTAPTAACNFLSTEKMVIRI